MINDLINIVVGMCVVPLLLLVCLAVGHVSMRAFDKLLDDDSHSSTTEDTSPPRVVVGFTVLALILGVIVACGVIGELLRRSIL